MIDQWATDFWQKRIERYDFIPAEDEDVEADCVFALLLSTNHAAIHHGEKTGARFMDFRVEYARETAPEVGISRPVTPDDIDALAVIARTAFRSLTRFYADPHFPDERCDDLYEGWFRENAADEKVEILMIGDGGGPAGFVTINTATPEASIVLIAVAESARGHGMGENLTRAAVNHAYALGIPSISVVTQGCNIPSQRAFQAAGFRIRSSGVWMHRWAVDSPC